MISIEYSCSVTVGYVLTAKHCVEGESMENISVKLGKHSRTATDENQATSSVSEVIYHSEYDAAILKVRFPICNASESL